MSTKTSRALKSGAAVNTTVDSGKVKASAKRNPSRATVEQSVGAAASTPNKTYDTLIVGAGFGGLGTAIKMKEAGLSNFVVLERAADVGGTWRDNQYPGAACDIPSNLYSFSFAPNPNWGSSYSGAKEIMGYIHHLVEEFGLKRFLQFNQNVADVRLNEEEGVWYVTTSEGVVWKGRSVVMASGALANASFPKIPGIETYKGKKIHSAQWDHQYDLTGKRVAVIGTGASAIQIIPELVKKVDKLKVFQRTPAWVMPRLDFKRPEWTKKLFAAVPGTQMLTREGLFWAHEAMALALIWDSPMRRLAQRLSYQMLKLQVKDTWMRRQLKPDFKIGCKRVLVSNEYYPALQAPNAELITWPIAGICETGIKSSDGLIHQVDAIVFATGFDIPKSGTPYPIQGVGGRILAQEWSKGAQAYKSVNISGYPNLFILFGPNSGPGHNSALVYMEQQIGYTVKAVQKILGEDLKMLDVRPEAQAEYNKAIQKRLAKTNWNSGCKSWYLTEDGFNATMYPGFATQYAAQMAKLDVGDYRAVKAAVAV